MVRHESLVEAGRRGPSFVAEALEALASLRARLAEAWSHARPCTPLEAAIDEQVRRYLGRRPPEEGDVAIVNGIVRDLTRRYDDR